MLSRPKKVIHTPVRPSPRQDARACSGASAPKLRGKRRLPAPKNIEKIAQPAVPIAL